MNFVLNTITTKPVEILNIEEAKKQYEECIKFLERYKEDGTPKLQADKIAIIGDLHFGYSNFNREYLTIQLEALERYAEELRKLGVKDIFQLGDMFDNRMLIDIAFLDHLGKEFKRIFKDFTFNTFTGNHDMYYRNNRDVVSSEVFKDILGVVFHKDRTDFQFGQYKLTLMSWLCGDEKVITDTDILLGHHGFKGYHYTTSTIDTHSESILDLSKYKKVYMGHFHLSQDVYAGTPYQLMNFNELGNVPSIIVLDTDLNETKIENTWSPRHFKMDVYADRIEYTYKNGVYQPLDKNFPEICKVGKIIVKEDNPKIEQLISLMSSRAKITVQYENDRVKFDKPVETEDNHTSSDCITEFIKKNDSTLVPLLEEIFKV